MKVQSAVVLVIALFFAGCSPNPIPAAQTQESEPGQTNNNPSASQPTPTPGSDIAPTQIHEGLNPLTGLTVPDASLLELPAMLVSISTFPVTARPQAGLSFAPFVFEIYITEGTTRYLTTFYGEFPAPEVPLTGDCDVRREPFELTDLILGSRVWLDANQSGKQDDYERGAGGVCVNLYDEDLNLLKQTATDSNGYYGFNVSTGRYSVAFAKPDGTEFTQKNIGVEEKDSDVDQATGWAEALDVTSTLLSVDEGLIPSPGFTPTSELPPAQVGPVRSGRLVYADIADFFKGSCLIYAFASAEVLVELPKCAFVDHNIQGGGYMLDIDELTRLAEDRRDPGVPAVYVSNIFSDNPPDGGMPASKVYLHIAWLNETGWYYDSLSESYWRYVDESTPERVGILHPEIDRLTGRQLQFENVIVLFAQHDVISPTNLDIHLEQDWLGDALLFRDGKMYKIRWSTVASEEELQTGIRKPIKFYFPDETTLFPLKPGHTWVSIVTPTTTLKETRPAEWWVQFSQPPGAK
ncbi:MAG: DUF3048 domain-containing protein [Anaerolineae bacterium]|nr:DUF3048 domain-containing protein [Anaerolineae bacterium]